MSDRNAESRENSDERKTFDIPHTIKLEYPFDWGKDESVTEIIVERRLRAGDFKGISANDLKFDDMMKLAAKVTGQSRSFIEATDSIDFFKLTEVINTFLSNTPETGENG